MRGPFIAEPRKEQETSPGVDISIGSVLDFYEHLFHVHIVQQLGGGSCEEKGT